MEDENAILGSTGPGADRDVRPYVVADLRVGQGVREKSMRVAVYYSNRDVRVEERPVPAIGPGEMLVRVEASGICGSDVMEWYRIAKAPLVLGHEVAGVVAAVGEGVKHYKEGDRVVVYHHVPCNTCHYCLAGHDTACDTFRGTHFDPGGFAEYVRLRPINVDRGVYQLPDSISFEEGSFVEPLACVVRGQRLAQFKPGQSVLVIGSGITGLLHVQLARATGAGRIVATDIVDYRLEKARKLGADLAVNATEDVAGALRQLNDGRLADVAIVCTGATAAVQQAMRSVDRGGTVLIFAPPAPGVAIPLAFNDFWADEITIKTCYGGSPEDAEIAFALIKAGRLNLRAMITHRLGLGEAQRGFQLVAEARESIKVIIEAQR